MILPVETATMEYKKRNLWYNFPKIKMYFLYNIR